MRAVTFQSMLRMSSPCSYSRTSSKSRPEPRNTLRYVPRSISSARTRACTSSWWICWTTARSSLSSPRPSRPPAKSRIRLGYGHPVQHPGDDGFGCDLFGLRLVRDDEPVAHDVERDGLHGVRQDVVATLEERVRPGGE